MIAAYADSTYTLGDFINCVKMMRRSGDEVNIYIGHLTSGPDGEIIDIGCGDILTMDIDDFYRRKRVYYYTIDRSTNPLYKAPCVRGTVLLDWMPLVQDS